MSESWHRDPAESKRNYGKDERKRSVYSSKSEDLSVKILLTFSDGFSSCDENLNSIKTSLVLPSVLQQKQVNYRGVVIKK